MNVLMIQGVAFSCLFIPLTTMALASIPRHRMPDATGLNSLLRQTGGSIGLAAFATMLGRFATKARGSMLDNITTGRPEVMARFNGIEGMLMNRGFDPQAAHGTAAKIMDLQLRQQSMVLSFEHLFQLAGIAFLCVLPLVLLLKPPKMAAEHIDVHVEM
jgi:DHA2 family multidrug resistance protein